MTDQSNALQAWHDSAVISPAALDEALKAQRTQAPVMEGGGGAKLLRIDQEGGEFVYGQENVPPEANSLWAINPMSLEIGWVLWENRKKVGEVMGPLGKCPPQPADGKAWDKNVQFELTCIEGTDDIDERIRLSNSSKGAHKAWDKLCKALANRPNIDYSAPVVRLSVDSYVNKNWSKTIYEPVFTVVDWLHPETGERLAADTAERSLNAEIPFPDLKEEAPAVPSQEQAADAPIIKRARRRTRSAA